MSDETQLEDLRMQIRGWLAANGPQGLAGSVQGHDA